MSDKKTYKKFYVISIVLFLIGIATFLWIIFASIDEAVDYEDGHSLMAPGIGQMSLDSGGSWYVYVEIPSDFSSEERAAAYNIMVDIWHSDSESSIKTEETIMPSNYSGDGIMGVELYFFELEEGADIIVDAYYTDGDGPKVNINISKNATGTIVAGIIIGIIALIFIGLIALVFLVIAIVKHSNYSKRKREINLDNPAEY